MPPVKFDYSQYKYLLFDGTYFHKQGCLILLMDVPTQKVIMNAYVATESYYTVRPLLSRLNGLGLRPKALIMDGHRMIIRAIREIWDTVTIQRCIYHIQREGLRWLRTYPKTEAGKELRFLLRSLPGIKSIEKRDQFINQYASWITKHKQFVLSLPSSTVAYKDLKKTKVLISNAIPDMFHFLNDSKIHSTTNLLESFFSRLKADFRRHRGLSESHKQSYLRWYCYFKGHQKSNTF
jgi:transposase-like protein